MPVCSTPDADSSTWEAETLSAKHLNVVGLLLAVPFLIPFLLAWWLLPHARPYQESDLAIYLGLAIVCTVFHEGAHALAAILIGGVRPAEVSFGFNWRGLMPYCHVHRSVTLRDYRHFCLAPFFFISLPLLAACLVFPAPWLLLLAWTMLIGCAGDVWIWLKLRPYAPLSLVQDHPTDCGCLIRAPNTGG